VRGHVRDVIAAIAPTTASSASRGSA
jgi:hypothetical protein